MFYDTPTVNGLFYSREMLEAQFKEKISNHLLCVVSLDNFYKNMDGSVNLSNVAAIAKDIKEVDGKIVLDIEFVKSPAGDELKNDVNEKNIEFSIAGLGDINKVNVVENYILSCITYSEINS